VKKGAGDEDVVVELETAVLLVPVEGVVLVHGRLGDADDAPIMHEKRGGAVGDEEGEGNPLHVLRLPAANGEGLFVGGDDLLLKLLVVNPFDLGQQFADLIFHFYHPFRS